MKIVLHIFEKNITIQKIIVSGKTIEECIYKSQKLMREKGLINYVIY
jgi:hypothetical protein